MPMVSIYLRWFICHFLRTFIVTSSRYDEAKLEEMQGKFNSIVNLITSVTAPRDQVFNQQ